MGSSKILIAQDLQSNSSKINRRDVLKLIGLGAGGIFASKILAGCENGVDPKLFYPHEFKLKLLGTTRPAYGDPKAKVAFVEFSDLTNYLCIGAYPTIQRLKSTYNHSGDVHVNFAHISIPLAKTSENALKALEGASNQGKYYKMYDLIYSQANLLYDDNGLFYLAGAAGLNAEKFRSDFHSEAISARMAEQRAVAQSLGINGVPQYLIGETANLATNRTIIEGVKSFEEISKTINLYLK